MRITRLQALGLKGHFLFTGPVDLDLSNIPAGVVALSGPNGHGKSTTLEAMFAAYWGEFPSHADVKNLADVADRKDAYLDVTSEFDGRGTYRARLNLDAVARATEGVLERVHPDGRRETLNDGKISTFRAAIAREFPPKELILASAFAAQGKVGSFAKLGKKERRDLFAALLGLEQFEARATTARTAAAAVDRRLVELRAERQPIVAAASDQVRDELDRQAQAFQADVVTLEQARDDAQTAIAGLEAAIERGRASAKAYAEASQALAALDARIAQLEMRRGWLAQDLQNVDGDRQREQLAIESARDQAVTLHRNAIGRLKATATLDAELDAALHRIETDLAVKLADRQERIDNNKTLLLDRATEIRAAATRVQALEQEIVDARDAQKAIRAGAADREVRRHTTATRFADVKRQIESRAHDSQHAELLDGVPCHGGPAFVGCQFLQLAAVARQRVSETSEADLLTQLEAALRESNAAVVAIDRAQEHVLAWDSTIAALEQSLATERPLAARLAQLDDAETRRAELLLEQEQLRLEAKASIQRATADQVLAEAAIVATRTEHEQAIASSMETAIREAAAAAARAKDRRHLAQAELDAVEIEHECERTERARLTDVIAQHTSAHNRLEADEAALVRHQREYSDRRVQLARLQEQIAVLERRRAEWTTARTRSDELTAAIVRLERDLVEWELLARILGRDGLPTLEIDAAGPGVSALANDLLQACFGTRFTVDLITQEVKADGKGFKEVFELRVLDGERAGEPKDLADLSGGEQVIVEEALRNGIAIYINRRNELPIRTMWRDETIGALDPENSLRYVAMLRRLREMAGIHHLFFVSHNRDASDLADVQLRVHDGQIDVVYPPFTEAA